MCIRDRFVAVSPLKPGSVCVTSSSTNIWGSMLILSLIHILKRNYYVYEAKDRFLIDKRVERPLSFSGVRL